MVSERNTTESYNAVPYPRAVNAGASKDKRWVYLLVADGKLPLPELDHNRCDILKHWCGPDAAGLDGGGSSEIIVNNKVANRPSDGKNAP